MRHAILAMTLLLTAAFSAAMAQQVTMGNPVHSVSDSFYERTGVSWGANFGGVNFSFGGGGGGGGGGSAANPQFGGFQPGSGLNGGAGFAGGGGSGFLNFGLSQGSRQSMVSQTPSVTTMNGHSGSIQDASLTPFVISYVPVVGGFPTIGYFNPIRPLPAYGNGMPMTTMPMPQANHRIRAMREAIAKGNRPAVNRKAEAPVVAALPQLSSGPSSATRAAPSVAAARRLHEQEQSIGDGEAMIWFERGKTAEAGGKLKTAKIFYQMAARRANGALRARIEARLATVSE
jgi:hypothetical protein